MAMYENSECLDKEIERLTKRLSTLDPTGEDYKAVRISLDTLYKLRNEQYKIDTEDLEKRDKSEAEIKLKTDELEVRKRELALAEKRLEAETQQKAEENDTRTYEIEVMQKQHEDDIKSQKANRMQSYITTGISTVVGIVKMAAFIGFALMTSEQGYKFEETGTQTSKTFREGMKNAFDMVKDQFKRS